MGCDFSVNLLWGYKTSGKFIDWEKLNETYDDGINAYLSLSPFDLYTTGGYTNYITNEIVIGVRVNSMESCSPPEAVWTEYHPESWEIRNLIEVLENLQKEKILKCEFDSRFDIGNVALPNWS